jgi:tRNA U55 pseudouridine synthase TruB
MSSLRRTRIGEFKIDDSKTIEQFLAELPEKLNILENTTQKSEGIL